MLVAGAPIPPIPNLGKEIIHGKDLNPEALDFQFFSDFVENLKGSFGNCASADTYYIEPLAP